MYVKLKVIYMSNCILCNDCEQKINMKKICHCKKRMLMTGTLTKEQIENIIHSQSHGRLACSEDNKPYIVPVCYGYDGQYMYCQSKQGKKLTILRKNPNICFQIDTVTNLNHWQSVLIYGTFEELDVEEAVQARSLLFSKVLTLMTETVAHSFEHNSNKHPIDDSNRIKEIMFRINILETTGRFEK